MLQNCRACEHCMSSAGRHGQLYRTLLGFARGIKGEAEKGSCTGGWDFAKCLC